MTEIRKEELWDLMDLTEAWLQKLNADMENNECNTVSVLCVMQLMGMNLESHAKNLLNEDETVEEAVILMRQNLTFLKKLGES